MVWVHSGGLLLQGPRSGSANVQVSFAKVLHGEDLACAVEPHSQLRVSAGLACFEIETRSPASSLGVVSTLEPSIVPSSQNVCQLT